MRSAELRNRPPSARNRPSIDRWLAAWIDDQRPPAEELDHLTGNVHHVSDAWNRVTDGNVLLVHFTDLLNGREATMRRVAAWLGIDVPAHAWPSLSDAASFDSMRANSRANVPDRLGVLKDPEAFFRSGSSGEGTQLCSDDLLRRYADRMSSLTTPEVRAWLHKT